MRHVREDGSSTVDRLLATRRLVVCVGPGGVGKTTVAAALGVRAAQLGRRALVLTIDPARRLATALGVAGLGDAEREVALGEYGGAGRLCAAMLEPGSSYDALITRIAEPGRREAILGNRVYQIMSRAFSAAHAYVAMERLHEVMEGGRHEVVILDTPPTRSALEILDAPGRLLAFLDERVLGMVLGGPAPGFGGRVLARGGAAARRLLVRLAGEGLVGDLVEFLGLFVALRPGFVARAATTQGLLQGEDAAFVLCASARADNLADASRLRDGLGGRGVAVEAVVFNRAYVPLTRDPARNDAPPRPPAAGFIEALAGDDEGARRLLAPLLDGLDRVREASAADNARLAGSIEEFSRAMPPEAARIVVPELAREPQDVRGLAELAGLLAAASSSRGA